MKTFYTINYTTANYDISTDGVTGYTTTMVAAESMLADAVAYFGEEDQSWDNNYTIRRFVETTVLNTTTDTWEIVTEERPVIYFPNVLPKPEPLTDPWASIF